ncbi:MAG: PD-(D/E)XK nuclease family protein [Jaaginema sp. PMC 1079.18]|nr:PD-(D/E)XK nuclease family protein [Jaaginema sp. PMC 1080.18]MEC4853071.1 PD-(D/E)XK nuclease family protein [Jaaginema sp. PMC 1079.18]MEC4865059.1 PD-(D/E)XK nuclease family protein [Jaaginema sp. PMC 1078.18]
MVGFENERVISDRDRPVLRLSQGHLNLLETCPRKFQHLYLEGLGSPNDPWQQEAGEWGKAFHLLMQQQELGLPIEGLLQGEKPLAGAIAALMQAAPYLFDRRPYLLREAEHGRSLFLQDYWLTVIYDLLLLEGDRAQIIDWKTYPQPRNSQAIAQNWQTRLYLYVLAETSDYAPEQLSMTYWFVRLPHQPEHLTLTYSLSQHQTNHQDLSKLLTQLTQHLERYQQDNRLFPQLPPSQQLQCDRCGFAALCQRPTAPLPHWLVTLDQVAEVRLN